MTQQTLNFIYIRIIGGVGFYWRRKVLADKRNYNLSFEQRRGLCWIVLAYNEDKQENAAQFAILQWQILIYIW